MHFGGLPASFKQLLNSISQGSPTAEDSSSHLLPKITHTEQPTCKASSRCQFTLLSQSLGAAETGMQFKRQEKILSSVDVIQPTIRL